MGQSRKVKLACSNEVQTQQKDVFTRKQPSMGDESLNRIRSVYTDTGETNLGSQSRLGKPCAKSKYARRPCIEASYYGLLDPDRVGVEEETE